MTTSLHYFTFFFFFTDTATTVIYTFSLHDALPICVVADEEPAGADHRRGPHVERGRCDPFTPAEGAAAVVNGSHRSEEHTSELQSLTNLVCRLLLEKKKKKTKQKQTKREHLNNKTR